MILLASPNAQVRRRWRQGLGRQTTRDVRDRGSLERLLLALKPTALLLDIALPGLRGVADVTPLQRLSRATRIIVLAATPSENDGLLAFGAGARGYCHRDIDPALLGKAIEVIQKGEIWASRALISRLVEELTARHHPAARTVVSTSSARLSSLTRREREIALLVGGGAANKEIAARLGVTERTVKAHLTTIFRKLGVSDRLRLALFLNGSGASRSPSVDAWREVGPKSNLRSGGGVE